MTSITMNATTYASVTSEPAFSPANTFFASGYMIDSATPALEPNQIIDPPNPTANARKPQSYPPWRSASAVSGMLSNTAETKPSPNAVCHDAAGSRSTGISDAHSTSASRNTVPLNAP